MMMKTPSQLVGDPLDGGINGSTHIPRAAASLRSEVLTLDRMCQAFSVALRQISRESRVREQRVCAPRHRPRRRQKVKCPETVLSIRVCLNG